MTEGEALRSLSDNIQSKLMQLRHYREYDAKLEHARVIADGRILQLEQVAQWVSDSILAVSRPHGETT